MKRDMELVRELLLKLEQLRMDPGDVFVFGGNVDEVAVEGYTSEQVEYHLDLLRELASLSAQALSQ